MNFPWRLGREELTAVAICSVFCATTVALTLLGDDIAGYIHRLMIDAQSEAVPALALHCAAVAVVMSIPVAASFWGREKIAAPFTPSILLYLLGIATAIYAGSRAGSGPHQ